MSGVEKIMESEYEIMKVLWAESPLTASEIYMILSKRKSWSKSTIITLINRLVEKEALSCEKRGVYFYTPVVTQLEYTKYHADSFLEKMFHGNTRNLLAYFCDNSDVTLEDLNELKQMIQDKGE